MLSLLIALLTSLIPAPQEPIPPVSEPATQEGAAEATQEPERPSRRPSRRSIELAPNDPEALAFLAQLVEAQRVEEDLPPVDAFRMEFELRDFVPDRGMNELEVRVDYRSENRSAEPPVLEAIRLYANDANYNEQVAKGLDDDGYWLRDNEGELLTLEAKEYANDREAIDATLVFCQDFLLLFDLDRLRQRAGGLKRIDHEQGTILEGELVRRRTERWKFQLFVPKDGDFPTRLALELPPVPKKEAPAEQQAEQPAADPGPQVITYMFGAWQPYAGRYLPSAIDEFHGAQPRGPRRAITVRRFVWRDQRAIETTRGAE
ncbi:MAG: hypothetical protein CMJ94_03745 [Planctomycetes bacterium]|nr:hypothetical protein [Planctomycetota bacterium]